MMLRERHTQRERERKGENQSWWWLKKLKNATPTTEDCL